MWATLALTALTLAPGQTNLELTNVRPTIGILGPERKDPKVLPGDIYVVAFDIAGLKVKEDGRVRYSMGMELIHNPKGGQPKSVFKKDPEEKEAVLHLGGTSLPNYATSIIGTDTPPGEYTMKVTVNDLEAKKTVTLVRNFEVIPAELGFVRVGLTYELPLPSPALYVPGQNSLLHFSLVGFKLDDKTSQPSVGIEMQIIDEATGKPTLSKPFKGEVKEVTKAFQQIIVFDPIPIQLNRPGKFKAVLKATDNLTKKTAEQVLSLTVVDPNK